MNSDVIILPIKNRCEYEFMYNLIRNVIVVSINKDYMGVAIDDKTAFVCTNIQFIEELIQDNNIIKIIMRPIGYIKSLLSIECKNCIHIGDYMNKKGLGRNIAEMKAEIRKQNILVENIALIGMKYITDKKICNKTQDTYNNKRDCYLLYLTAYNDIISRYGPMKFTDLTMKVREYDYLCKIDIHPAMALEGLIKTGALNSDTMTSLVSI